MAIECFTNKAINTFGDQGKGGGGGSPSVKPGTSLSISCNFNLLSPLPERTYLPTAEKKNKRPAKKRAKTLLFSAFMRFTPHLRAILHKLSKSSAGLLNKRDFMVFAIIG